MSNKYTKRNYVEVVQKITPSIYLEEDLLLATEEEDLSLKILRGDAELIESFSGVINKLLSKPDLSSYWEWDSSKEISRRVISGFIKQNNITNITTESFDLEVLVPLGYSLGDYSTSSSLKNFLSGTLFPKISIGDNLTPNGIIQTLTEDAFGSTQEETFTYLSKSLGLLYLCIYNHGSSPPLGDISSLALDLLATNLYESKPIVTADVINIFKEVLWTFQTPASLSNYPNFFIPEFVSGIGTWLSGVQGLEKLKTWTNILYSTTELDKDDTFVKDYFIDYFDNGITQTSIEKRGPFYKLQKAFGFLLADINNQIISLETLNSIEDCPKEYLPYLADLLGWEFYTSNVDSWRRQLREARALLQKKGTKQGLIDLLESILPAAHIDFENNFSEYYESYIPNLIYYILRTASSKFEDICSWNQEDADTYACGEFDPNNLDNSIRLVIDHILLEAVQKYPYLFNIAGHPFQLDSSSFVFNYRDRDFSIPPWEYEKFYKDCDLIFELVEFFSNKLKCLGVPVDTADAFEDYILDNTIRGYQKPEFYGNSFLFFTETLNLAPNYASIMENFEKKKFDYLPLWNGKSSHFNLTVSSGEMDDGYFVQTSFTTEDFFEALKSVKDFIPAKTIKRLHVDLAQSDLIFQYSKMHPRATLPTVDFANPSGAMASFELSTLDMRDDSLGMLGWHIDGSFAFGSPRSTNNHEFLPVFKRDRLKFGRVSDEDAYIDSSSVLTASGPYGVVQPRSAGRRRNFEKNLSKGQYFNRLGFNQPSFLNRTEERVDSGVTADFLTLGLIPSSNYFQTIDSVHDLPDVYKTCEHKDSTNIIKGAKTSLCFNVRGNADISIKDNFSHPYRFRDNLEDIHDFIFKHIDKKLFLESKLTIELNSHMLGNSSWKDETLSLKNKLWNDYDFSLENDFHEVKFDNYKMIPTEVDRSLNYLYLNDYVINGRHPLSQSLLNDLDLGGSSLLSHVYGPIFWNGHLTLCEGSTDVTGTDGAVINKKITSLGQNYEFDIMESGVIGTDILSAAFRTNNSHDLFNFTYFSGVEILTPIGPEADAYKYGNKMSAYNLSSDEGFIPKDSPLLGKNLLTLKYRSGLPRLRFPFIQFDVPEAPPTPPPEAPPPPPLTGSFYGKGDNHLSPEHNFSVEISSLHLKENSFLAGLGSVNFWIRTEPETLKNGTEVIWVYNKQGEWEMFDKTYFMPSTTDKKVEHSKVLNVCHTFIHKKKKIEKKEGCHLENIDKESLFHVAASDMEVDRVNFNTLNRKIKVPMSYYTSNHQVHRRNQKYVVEVFSDAAADEKKYWAFAGMNSVDETMALRSRLKFKFNLPDYTLTKYATDKPIQFFKPNGEDVPLGSKIFINISGEAFLGDDRLTIAIRDNNGKPKLYCTVNAIVKTFGNGEFFSIRFEGFLTLQNYQLADFLHQIESFNYTFRYFDNFYDIVYENFFNSTTEKLDFSRLPGYSDGDIIALSSFGEHTPGNPDHITPWPYWWVANPNLEYMGSGVGSTNLNPYGDDPFVEPTFSFSSIQDVSPFGTSSTVVSCSGLSIGNIKFVANINSYIKEYINEFDINWEQSQGAFSQPGHPPWISTDLSSWYAQYSGSRDQWTLGNTSYWGSEYDDGFGNNGPFWGDVHINQTLHPPGPFFERPFWGEPSDGWAGDNTWVVYTLAFNPNTTGLVNCEKTMIAASLTAFNPHKYNELFFRAIYDRTTDSVEHYEFNEDGANFLSSPEIREQIPSIINDPDFIQSGVFNLGEWRLMFLAINRDKTFGDFSLPYGNSWFNTAAGFELKEAKFEPTKMSIGLLRSEGGASDGALKIGKITGGYRGFSNGHIINESDFFTRSSDGEITAFIEGRDLGSLIKKEVDHSDQLKPTELLDLFRYFNYLSDTSEGRDINNSKNYHGYNGGGRSNYRIHPGPYDTGSNWDNNGWVLGVNLTN